MTRSRLRFLLLASSPCSALLPSPPVVMTTAEQEARRPAAGRRRRPGRAEGKKGGKLIELAASDVDYLDPGHTLLPVRVPDHLRDAQDRSTGSQARRWREGEAGPRRERSGDLGGQEDGHGQAQQGVKFAPPVNREVTSKDVKYAIERAFSTVNVGGQYTTYFNAHRGRSEGATSRAFRTSPASTTPDDYTIVFKLTKPVGVSASRRRWSCRSPLRSRRSSRRSSTRRTPRPTTRTSSPRGRT